MVVPRCGARAAIQPNQPIEDRDEAISPSVPSETSPEDTAAGPRNETPGEILAALISNAYTVRLEGNLSFRSKEYDHAVVLYSEAIHVLQEVRCF